jgi:beta-glucosidase
LRVLLVNLPLLGGRTFESFSEDPVLSGELAASYVIGLQSENVAATPKHFVCNECETERNHSNSIVEEKALRELYLLPFQICIRKANPWALMTAYNKVNGEWCSENEFLLEKILRKEWNYAGCTISDFGGVYNSLLPVQRGLNLEMPGPSLYRGKKIIELLKEEKLSMADIDRNVCRVIELSRKVGMLDEDVQEVAIPDGAASLIARQAATEGLVLLKNKGGVLPLVPDKLMKIAVFGAPASSPIIHGGGSSSLASHYVVTPLDALKATYQNIQYCYGTPIFRKLPSASIDIMKTANGEPGVDCYWYNGWSFGENEILHERLDTTRTLVIDPRIKGLEGKHCTRMQCTLTPKSSGSHTFGITACGETHLYVDGIEIVSHPGFDHIQVEHIMQPWRFEVQKSMEMVSNKPYSLVIDTFSTRAPPPHPEVFSVAPQATQVGFFENIGKQDIEELQNLASLVDASIIFTGNNKEWESESFDRTTMHLSPEQDYMVANLAKVSKKTIVVNQTGAPISMPWIDSVDAVIQNWFGGMEVGNAVADVISGRVSPSGRLPCTFPVRIEDLPSNQNVPCNDNLDIRYAEGHKIGYRAFAEPDTPAPLFYFGHGLSYATFQYTNFSVEEGRNSILCIVSVSVLNSSSRDGMETVQLYVDGSLKAFEKVMVPAGKTVQVELQLDKYAFSAWNYDSDTEGFNGSWTIEAREYDIDIRRDASAIIETRKWAVDPLLAGQWYGL